MREAAAGIDRDGGSVIVKGLKISLTNNRLPCNSITKSVLKDGPTGDSTDKTLPEDAEGVDRDNVIAIAEGAENSLTKAEPIVDPTGSDLKPELINHSDSRSNIVPANSLRNVQKHKRKRGRKSDKEAEFYKSHRDLWNRLNQRRTAEGAKERILFLGSEDPEAAMICWHASPDVEREHVSQFFDRHSTSQGIFLDDTALS